MFHLILKSSITHCKRCRICHYSFIPAPVESWKPNMTVSIIFCVAAVVSVFGISFACRTCLKKKKAGDTQVYIYSIDCFYRLIADLRS